MKTKTWGSLDSLELTHMFSRLFGVDIQLGRDSSLLKRVMEEKAISPLQVLYGFILFKEMTATKTVYIFCQNANFWADSDYLEAAAEVCAIIFEQKLPVFFWTYLDLRSGGDSGDPRVEVAFNSAKTKLESWLHEWLSRTLSPGDRALSAKRLSDRKIPLGSGASSGNSRR